MRALLIATIVFSVAFAAAQSAATPGAGPAPNAPALPEIAYPTAAEGGAAADAAVLAWSERRPIAIADLADLPPEAICARLPDLLANPPPPEGTRVIVEERLPYPSGTGDDPDLRSFTYAAVRPGGALGVVRVDVRREGESWRAERVGFHDATAPSGMRAFLQTPPAAATFTLLSLIAMLSLLRPSPVRRALAAGLATARRHRRLVGATMALLYGVFAFGIGGGRALPEGCDAAVFAVVADAVTRVGATEAYASGDVARAALVTFYQNFVVVTVGVHFFLGLLGGLPSLLIALPQFFVLGVPFGLLPSAPAALLPMVTLIALELTAYFLVVAGALIVFLALLRRGFGAYPIAVREAATLLAPAALLLLVGAWYEALLLIVVGS